MDYTKEDIGLMLAVFATSIVEGVDVETDEEEKMVEAIRAVGLQIIDFLEKSSSFNREESIYDSFMRMANKYLESIKDESN